MKLQLRLFILFSLISICLNAQNFETNISKLDIISCNAITSLDNSNTLVSGYELDYIPFLALEGSPALQLSTAEGEFLDTISYPQFSFMTILQSRNDGRVLGIASDTLNERYFFITIGDELSDIKLNRFLAINADFNITKINNAAIENNQVVLDAIINKNQESIRVLLYYDELDLRLVRSINLPESETYHRLPSGNKFYIDNSFNQPVNIKKYDTDWNLLWERNYDDYFLNTVYEDPSGRTFVAGSKFHSDGKSDAIIAELDKDGILVNNNNITESDPDLWNFRISFEKILPYKDKLIAIGTDNYNSDSWSGSHNFLMVVYDLNLNQLNVVKKGHSAARAYVTEAEIIDDYVIGIADAFPFENKFSYQFKVDLSELISTASSQDFVDPANEWIMADGFYNFNIGQWVSKTYKYKFTDSIVIDGKTYLELKHAEAPDFTDFEAPLFFHGDYYRQEDQIVYVSNGVEEKPVYDFGFMVGDSSDITRRETIVSSLDTITLLDGSIRETKILSRDNIPRYTIIDDIGATLWTFNTQRLGSFDVETTLLCFSHEEELLYKNALDCQQYTTTSTKAVKPEAYSLSKIGQTIKVYSQNFSDLSIKLFDISGRLIDQGELTNGLFAINSDLPTGLIVCQVFQKSKMVHTSMIFND